MGNPRPKERPNSQAKHEAGPHPWQNLFCGDGTFVKQEHVIGILSCNSDI